MHETKTLINEFRPGIFRTLLLLTGDAGEKSSHEFLIWKSTHVD
jgi:hypothetical protein